MKLKKSLAVVLTSAALFSVCTGTMVEASKSGEYKSKEQQEQDYAVKEYKFLEELITKNLNEIKTQMPDMYELAKQFRIPEWLELKDSDAIKIYGLFLKNFMLTKKKLPRKLEDRLKHDYRIKLFIREIKNILNVFINIHNKENLTIDIDKLIRSTLTNVFDFASESVITNPQKPTAELLGNSMIKELNEIKTQMPYMYELAKHFTIYDWFYFNHEGYIEFFCDQLSVFMIRKKVEQDRSTTSDEYINVFLPETSIFLERIQNVLNDYLIISNIYTLPFKIEDLIRSTLIHVFDFAPDPAITVTQNLTVLQMPTENAPQNPTMQISQNAVDLNNNFNNNNLNNLNNNNLNNVNEFTFNLDFHPRGTQLTPTNINTTPIDPHSIGLTHEQANTGTIDMQNIVNTGLPQMAPNINPTQNNPMMLPGSKK